VIFLVRAVLVLLNAGANAKDLEHTSGRASEDDDGKDDNDEDGRAKSVGVLSLDADGEGDSDLEEKEAKENWAASRTQKVNISCKRYDGGEKRKKRQTRTAPRRPDQKSII
jgi:hypothetical protein